MNEEFIECKKHPITNCYDLTKHFIGNHGGTIVYLSPNFEIDFMRRMSRTDELQQQNQQYKEVFDKVEGYIKKRTDSCTAEANSTTNDTMCRITIVGLKYLLDILKEVK